MQEQIIEQSIDSIEFEDKQKEDLFNILISQKHYISKPFSEQDLKVDLVLRMPLPNVSYNLKFKQPSFDALFKNTPKVYEQMYTLVGQYINYLVQKNGQTRYPNMIRTMTSIVQITPPQVKQVRLDLYTGDPRPEGQDNVMEMDCSYVAHKNFDTFSLKYNMIMVILEQLCGFRVRPFLLEDQSLQKNEKTPKQRCLYLLCSQNTQNLIKTASKYRVKKQMSMNILDFLVNDPVDDKGRPIKINSFFKTKEAQGFSDAIRRVNRDLGESNKQFSDQIIQEFKLKPSHIQKFEKYFQELQYEINRVFPPRQFKDKIDPMNPMSKKGSGDLSGMIKKTALFIKKSSAHEKRESWQKQYGNLPFLDPKNLELLNKLGLQKLNRYEKEYIFMHNRHKINKGCEQMLLNLKKKKYMFEKILELNQKYGYKAYDYKDTFAEFVLPNKRKSFFQKLKHMLQYQYYNMTPYGQLTLFTNMERIKLAYLNIQQYIKIQNLRDMGIDLYAINNQYERNGDLSYQYDNRHTSEQNEKAPMHKPVSFMEQAYHWVGFMTNFRAVRDYFGDNYGFQLTFKVYLIVYLMIISPIAILFQLSDHFYFNQNRTKEYIRSVGQLLILFFSYTVFIEIWKKQEQKYFNNFIEQYQSTDQRAAYRGPFVRNLVEDNMNHFQTPSNLWQSLRNMANYGLIILIFINCTVYFGLIRRVIVSEYNNFIQFQNIISTCHITFYGVYFLSIYILYELIFKRLVRKTIDIQNLAKQSEYDKVKRNSEYILFFSIELIGPIFFFFLENFNGTTCYARNCVIEFEHYVVSRYILETLFNMVFDFGKILLIARNQKIKQIYYSKLSVDDQDTKKTFQYKLSKLLLHVQCENNKEEFQYTVKSQMTIFIFFSIFFIRFAFCQILSLIVLVIDYHVQRKWTLKLKRRPIPDSARIYRYTPMLKAMYYTSLVVNSFSLIFNDSFMEYDLKHLYSIFVTTLTEDNMLTFKLVVTFVVFIFFLSLTLVFQRIGRKFGQSATLEKRKVQIFKQFVKKANRKPIQYKKVGNVKMMKSIFRTFAVQTIIEYKKNKFNFLKRRLKQSKIPVPSSRGASPAASPRPSEVPGQLQNSKTDISFTKKKTGLNETMYKNKLEGMMKKKSKWSKPSYVDNLNTTYRNVAEAHMESQAHIRNADYI